MQSGPLPSPMLTDIPPTTDRSVEDVATLSGDPIVNEARRRLDRGQEWYAEANRRFLEDLKFAYADSENGYQWPNAIRHSRDVDQRPCLTMNVVRQHNFQIVNQMSQAKADIKIVAQGGGASAESAEVFKWLTKHVEYQSNAQAAYWLARKFQVDGGRGYWRVVTDWAGPDTFDQEIYIRPITDPLSVVMDPDAKQRDKSDSKWCLIFDIVPKDEFEGAYPELRSLVGDQPLGTASTGADWIPKDHIMLCEYFRKVPVHDTLYSFVYEGQRLNIRESQMPPNIRQAIADAPDTRTRDVVDEEVEWYLIAGDRRIDETKWLGKYIPIVPIFGEETLAEGIYDCKGHTRAMKDAQRMFNYFASSSVEFGALQTKVPWVAPIEAIEQYMTYWETANQTNHAFLPYKSVNEMAPEKPIPPPMRPEPPTAAPMYEMGMQTAFNQMMMTSGQWQNQMGMQGNERTGEAIARRQDQGDTATFHFQDNYAEGLRFTGKILIDLFPKIYDTKRVLHIVNDEGLDFDLTIDPTQQQAFVQEMDHRNEVVGRIFNPAVGRYDVAADVGPATGTRREENVEAFTLLLTQAPALTGLIGDLMLKNMDFEDAQEAARRLRRMVPPQALGQGPSPNEAMLTQRVQQLEGLLAKTMQRAGMDRLKVVDKEVSHGIESYRAETDRLSALAGLLPTDPQGLQQMIEQLVKDTLATHLLPLMQGQGDTTGPAGTNDDDSPPVDGAQKAPDGEWYLQDPTREGKYLRVVPLAQERQPRNIISNA